MTDPLSGLSPILREIAEASDLEAAMTLAGARGGQRVYFPTPDRLTDSHWIVKAIGWQRAQTVCTQMAARQIEMPLAGTGIWPSIYRAIDARLANGDSVNKIASALRISRRTVYRHKARSKAHPCGAQASLF